MAGAGTSWRRGARVAPRSSRGDGPCTLYAWKSQRRRAESGCFSFSTRRIGATTCASSGAGRSIGFPWRVLGRSRLKPRSHWNGWIPRWNAGSGRLNRLHVAELPSRHGSDSPRHPRGPLAPWRSPPRGRSDRFRAVAFCFTGEPSRDPIPDRSGEGADRGARLGEADRPRPTLSRRRLPDRRHRCQCGGSWLHSGPVRSSDRRTRHRPGLPSRHGGQRSPGAPSAFAGLSVVAQVRHVLVVGALAVGQRRVSSTAARMKGPTPWGSSSCCGSPM